MLLPTCLMLPVEGLTKTESSKLLSSPRALASLRMIVVVTVSVENVAVADDVVSAIVFADDIVLVLVSLTNRECLSQISL